MSWLFQPTEPVTCHLEIGHQVIQTAQVNRLKVHLHGIFNFYFVRLVIAC